MVWNIDTLMEKNNVKTGQEPGSMFSFQMIFAHHFFFIICQLNNLELGDSTAKWSNLPGAEHLVYILISGMSLNL
jgi:hypothetical protein